MFFQVNHKRLWCTDVNTQLDTGYLWQSNYPYFSQLRKCVYVAQYLFIYFTSFKLNWYMWQWGFVTKEEDFQNTTFRDPNTMRNISRNKVEFK